MGKFDNISDELLAAFLDGNVSADESAAINEALAQDDFISEAADIAQDGLSFEEKLDLWQGDYGFWELGLPPVIDEEDFIKNDDMKLGATTYGYEPNNQLENFDPYIFQNYSNTCAIRSQQIVLRDYGIMLSQEDMMKYGEAHHWYDPDPENGGTPMFEVGNFLDECGVTFSRTENANIYDIICELRAGHRIIVGVDADELWVNRESSGWKRTLYNAINKLNDHYLEDGANHALVVAGVDVNPDNPADISVTLIDPGSGEVCASYPYAQFKDAWEDSHCFMVSTNEPAPYQYDYEHHKMEPSGFASTFIPANIELPEGLDNGFKLAESYYSDFKGYEPEYSDSHFAGEVYSDDSIPSTEETHNGDSDDSDSDDNASESEDTSSDEYNNGNESDNPYEDNGTDDNNTDDNTDERGYSSQPDDDLNQEDDGGEF